LGTLWTASRQSTIGVRVRYKLYRQNKDKEQHLLRTEGGRHSKPCRWRLGTWVLGRLEESRGGASTACASRWARLDQGTDRQIVHRSSKKGGAMRLRLRLGARASTRCQARAIMYDAQDRYRGDSRPGSRGYHRPSAGAAEAEAMPARTDRAINTDAIVFMARTPYPRSGQHHCRP